MTTILYRQYPSNVPPSHDASLERRFIPAAEFDADMGRMPVSDANVHSIGMNDRDELADWQQSEPTIDYDEGFGASMLIRADEPTTPAVTSLAGWSDAALVQLIKLAMTARDEAMLDAATGELLNRFRKPAA